MKLWSKIEWEYVFLSFFFFQQWVWDVLTWCTPTCLLILLFLLLLLLLPSSSFLVVFLPLFQFLASESVMLGRNFFKTDQKRSNLIFCSTWFIFYYSFFSSFYLVWFLSYFSVSFFLFLLQAIPVLRKKITWSFFKGGSKVIFDGKLTFFPKNFPLYICLFMYFALWTVLPSEI